MYCYIFHLKKVTQVYLFSSPGKFGFVTPFKLSASGFSGSFAAWILWFRLYFGSVSYKGSKSSFSSLAGEFRYSS